MKGCLVPLLGGLGVVLLLPGMCSLSGGTLANSGGPLIGAALALIAVAFLLAVLWNDS